MVEWDSNLPAWPALRTQALSARQIMAEQEMPLAGEASRAG
jgi:hypothetical protein